MELGLKDKVAFITGASRGSGKGIARSLAREGGKVALTATRAVIPHMVKPDGSLLVSDERNGAIYRVSYGG